MKVFFDTSILVYLFDAGAAAKSGKTDTQTNA